MSNININDLSLNTTRVFVCRWDHLKSKMNLVTPMKIEVPTRLTKPFQKFLLQNCNGILVGNYTNTKHLETKTNSNQNIHLFICWTLHVIF